MTKKSVRRNAHVHARPASDPMGAASSDRKRATILSGAALVAMVFAVFGPTIGDSFFTFDDPSYVTDNALVQRGLTLDGARWALTTSDFFYWHPLTWLSHMMDCQLFGLNSAGHHVTNVVIYALTTLLVFAAFAYMTGAFWRSGLVAALFAVHPLHVEPVAWIAERKELLAGFFWFAAILAYAFYARRPSWKRYLLCVAAFVLGLMSKPVVVTLPLMLLLLDFWPLGRLAVASPGRLLLEKVPLLILSAASSMFTYVGQRRAGAMSFLSHVTLVERLQHAVLAYAIYVRQTIWPHPLAPLYPYEAGVHPALLVTSAALLAALSVLAWSLRARAPFLLFGWLWFVGTLLPTIGLIQVGAQSHADRFAYLPLVGLFVMAVWGGALWLQGRVRTQATIGLAAALIAILAATASAQVRYWQNSVGLLEHTLAITHDNPLALHLLAFSLASEGRIQDAVPYYRESLRLNPRNPLGYYSLGLALIALDKPGEAVPCFAEAARLHPAYAEAHYSLGATLLQLNRLAPAREELEAALRLPLNADYSAQAHFRLGLIAAYEGDLVRARDGFAAALQFRPDFPEARANLTRAAAQLKTKSPGRPE
ncbi:MAG TPA: tetratricopeptide repeat protein [Vicinamibacterales bacterium]|nr:tetratricopeptide repeat protein [Vicinamibacterales bacterium]